MDLEEQYKAAEEIKEFISKKFREKPFHVIIAIEPSAGVGVQLSFGTLNERSAFETWQIIVGGLADNAEELLEKFNIRENVKFNKLVNPK